MTSIRLVFLVCALMVGACVAIPALPDAPRVEPLVPTPPLSASVAASVESPLPQATPTRVFLVNENGYSPPPTLPAPGSLRARVGVGIPDAGLPTWYAWSDPRPGWYLNWSAGLASDERGDVGVTVPADETAGMAFVPMVRVPRGELVPEAETLRAGAGLLPGRVWLIGNEPDVAWQDGATPLEYARAYAAAYAAIKAGDPTAQVAAGGISQVTPLRLRYLDAVLAAYRAEFGAEMPVDVWAVHIFVLQEKAGDWGVGIPPGMEDATEGTLWRIDDHDDLALVEGQARAMREWMAARGYGDRPLWVTEYGVLMPAEYGFDAERVRRFLLGSFDLFANLRDAEFGLKADDGAGDGRLVQRWLWFSAGYDAYPTGDLFDRAGQATPLLDAMRAYLAEYEAQKQNAKKQR